MPHGCLNARRHCDRRCVSARSLACFATASANGSRECSGARRPTATERCHRNGRIRRDDGKDRQPLQAAGLRLPVLRNLRRARQLLGLRPARRRAEAQRQGSLVARHRHHAPRRRRPRLLDHDAPAQSGRPRGTSRTSPTRWSTARSARGASAPTTSTSSAARRSRASIPASAAAS